MSGMPKLPGNAGLNAVRVTLCPSDVDKLNSMRYALSQGSFTTQTDQNLGSHTSRPLDLNSMA